MTDAGKLKCERQVFDMTDEEIVQEATEAVDKNLNAGCYVGDLLRIINRKKLQIKKLENIERFATKTIEKQDAEIGRLQQALDEAISESDARVRTETINEFWCGLEQIGVLKGKEKPTLEELLDYIEQVKAEAIKEFAERLEYTSEDTTDWGHPYVLCKDIDNLVKEMTEQNNDFKEELANELYKSMGNR